MEWKGMIITCDKCGREFRCELIGQTEADGGFTRTDRYMQLPKTWKYRHEIGYLCPDCEAEFEELIQKFMNEGNKK